MRFLVNNAVAVNRSCCGYISIKYNCRHNTKRLLSLLIFISIGLVEGLLSADINRDDLRESIRRGSQFLYNNQDSTGWWSDPDLPALTGLALVALKMTKVKDLDRKYESERMRAYDYLTSLVKRDGTIHAGRLINYNTACSLMAFSVSENDRYQSIIRKARASIANSQIDIGEKGKLDNPHDGGVGYNSKYDHSDMNNTLMAVEAMRMSEMALRGSEKSVNRPVVDLDWKALEHFLASCQNLPERSNNPNLSKNVQDRGGFIYHPGESKAGEVVDEKSNRIALRSYGSISYAGMMSFAYARIGKDDERVKAVMTWLGNNYTLEENPGMGQEGLYYYFHLMAKSLSAQDVDKLKVADGRHVNWKRDLVKRLVSLQNPDGSWKNSNKRWMEGDPILTTSYVLIALSLLSE